jgi:hypothetical protein
MGWYERDLLPLGIKGLSELGKVCIWIGLCSLRLVEQLRFLQVRSDNRTQFFKVQNIQIKTKHVCTTATTDNALYFQNGIHGNHKFVSHFQYNISWAFHAGKPVVPTTAGHHVKLIFYTIIPTNSTMYYYASSTDPVGRTAFIEETARKTVKLREVNSFCKLGKDRKGSLSFVEHVST